MAEVAKLNIGEATGSLISLKLTPEEEVIASKNCWSRSSSGEVSERRGLDYLTLDRLSMTLSGERPSGSNSRRASGRPGGFVLRAR